MYKRDLQCDSRIIGLVDIKPVVLGSCGEVESRLCIFLSVLLESLACFEFMPPMKSFCFGLLGSTHKVPIIEEISHPVLYISRL